MLFPNLEAKIAAMKERQATRDAKKKSAANARQNAIARARRKALRAAIPKAPRRRKHPLDSSVRALRVRLRKQIAAGALPADTELSNETLCKEVVRCRHSRGALRFYHRKQKRIRSQRWAGTLGLAHSAKARSRPGKLTVRRARRRKSSFGENFRLPSRRLN